MKRLRSSSEAEMVGAFLKAEYLSERFSERVKEAMTKWSVGPGIILKPDYENAEENGLRKCLLGEHRGYGQSRDMFAHFPSEIEWSLCSFDTEDLPHIRYIEYSYWNELSEGTHLPVMAVDHIRKGITVFDVPNDGFLRAEEHIRRGGSFANMIFLTADFQSFVILEGHQRMTAYALAPDFFRQIEVFVGRCSREELADWIQGGEA